MSCDKSAVIFSSKVFASYKFVAFCVQPIRMSVAGKQPLSINANFSTLLKRSGVNHR